MKYLLLASAAVIALGVGAAQARSMDEHYASALSVNIGNVESNRSAIYRGSNGVSMLRSFDGSRGVMQAAQNAGANSAIQNSTAVAALWGIELADRDPNVALATSRNRGEVHGSGNESTLGRASRRSTGPGLGAELTNSFGGVRGVAQAAQNAGPNSLLQNSVAVAALVFCDRGCPEVDLARAVATSRNNGDVYDNRATQYSGSAHANMTGSFNGAAGIMQASQNVGSNSLLQNSVAVGAILPQAAAAGFLR